MGLRPLSRPADGSSPSKGEPRQWNELPPVKGSRGGEPIRKGGVWMQTKKNKELVPVAKQLRKNMTKRKGIFGTIFEKLSFAHL